MIKEISFIGTVLFFISSMIGPATAYPNKAYEIFDFNEKVISLGTFDYDAQLYELYQVGNIYVVLGPSGDIVKDRGIIQNVIFTYFVFKNAEGYEQTYNEVGDTLISLKSVINETRINLGAIGVLSLGIVYVYEPSLYELLKGSVKGEFDFNEQLSLSASLSSHTSALATSPSYDEAYDIKEENQRLLEELLEIRDNTALWQGGSALNRVGNKIKKIPLAGGDSFIENIGIYMQLINSLNANFEEVQKISSQLSQFSSDAATFSSSSISRIEAKQDAASRAYQDASSELASAQNYIEGLFLETFLEPPEETPLYSAETAISNVQSMIEKDEYNSAINDIEDTELQIQDSKVSAEDASMLIDLLEFQVWKINRGIDVVDDVARFLNTEQSLNLSIAKNKSIELKTNLTIAEGKFSEGEYGDAKKLALNSVVESVEVISILDSLMSQTKADDDEAGAGAGAVVGECGYYE